MGLRGVYLSADAAPSPSLRAGNIPPSLVIVLDDALGTSPAALGTFGLARRNYTTDSPLATGGTGYRGAMPYLLLLALELRIR